MTFTHVDGVLVVRRGVVPEHPVRQAALGPTARVRHVRVVVHLPALASRADLSDACAGVRAPVDRGEDRGAGRATPSCGRSLCVRTLRAVVSRVAPGRACGTGSETAPTFGDTSLARSAWANERTRADGSEALSHFWPITNSRISESDDTHTSRRRSACTFSGEGRTCRHIWRARHGVASTSPSSLGRRHQRCRCVDPRGREPWIPGQSPRPTGAPVVRDPDDERAPRWLFQPPLTTPFIHPPLDRTARGRRL